MNQRMQTSPLVHQTAASQFEQLINRPARFDPDAYHAMQERDNALIRDQVLHGSCEPEFVYAFLIKGKLTTGVSVVGARQLAAEYGGITARIVATVEKRRGLFIFRSFDPLQVNTQQIDDLESDEDFYECVTEVCDIKTGNKIQVRKSENRREQTRDGRFYDVPHFDVIAESKAFRNGVLAILPQSVIQKFEAKCLRAAMASGTLGPEVNRALTNYFAQQDAMRSGVAMEKTIDQVRDDCIAFATKRGLRVNRDVMRELSYAELDGLRAAAGDAATFRDSLESLGALQADAATTEPEPPAQKPAATVRQSKAKPPADGPAHDELLAQAIAAAEAGRADEARDLARGLPPEMQRRVEDAIMASEDIPL